MNITIKKWKSLRGMLLLLPLMAAPAMAAPPSAALIKQPVFACGSGLASKPTGKDKIFESVPTRPLALSDDGSLLFAINAKANCLEIYRTGGDRLTLASSVTVGVEPVAVAVRSASEVWVVNHISNSVSVIDIGGRPHVRDTLQVGDEPWDIVFANSARHGANPTVNHRDRAFVTAAFRGQYHPQFKSEYLLLNRLDTDNGAPGELIGRADVWAFDVEAGEPILAGIINTFTSSLRALAVDKQGRRVFATAFKSGNRTAVTPVPFDALVGEKYSADGVANLEPFAIVQQQPDKRWLDANGAAWPDFMNYDVADNDLFVIDATATLKLGNADQPLFNRHAILETVEGVGSVLFNSHFDDVNNRLLISAMDANNLIPMQERLKGIFVDNELKIVDFNKKPAQVTAIDLDELAGRPGGKAGLALLSGLVTVPGENTVVVTSMGTNQVVAFNPDKALAAPAGKKIEGFQISAVPLGPIAVIAGGEGSGTFYSYSYIGDSVSLLRRGAAGFANAFSQTLYNPELAAIQRGRRYLYDATLTSGNDRVSCASCHIFGGDDKLQWVADRADERTHINRLPFIEHGNRKTTARAVRLKHDPATSKVGDRVPFGDLAVEIKYIGDQKGFADRLASGAIRLNEDGLVYLTESTYDPRLSRFKILTGAPTWVLVETPFLQALRGPMRTTPLHGINDSGAMHYLGDKAGMVVNATGACSDKGKTEEERAFAEFNSPCSGAVGNFQTLMGGPRLPKPHMDDLTTFSLALSYPPNPIRPLDNRVNAEGERIFNHQKVGVDLSNWDDVLAKQPLIFACVDCHTISRGARMFGTSKKIYSAPPLSVQDAKVPHLRFLYDRAGFLRGDYRQTTTFLNMQKNLPHFDQVVHAQGLNHGGWFDFSMFFANYVWIVNPADPTAATPESKRMYFNLFSYLMEFDTNYLPMYGKQITVSRADIEDAVAAASIQRYLDNALHPKGGIAGKQCDIHAEGGAQAPSGRTTISGMNDLVEIMKGVPSPITLTCL